MNETLILLITVTSGLLVIYHHLGYPLILKWIQKRSKITVTQSRSRYYTSQQTDGELPSVAIVIPAHNEQQWIAEKIRNLAILDYPSERLKVIIACDGCNDDTVAIAKRTAQEAECRHLTLDVLEFAQNRGKVAVINEVLADVDSDLVALSDVSALVSVDALLIATAHFEDPEIGVLTGHYRLLAPGSAGESAYWKYQSQIKASEAALGSTLGAHGAFYLFRRRLFSPLAVDTINDDFILPMKIVAAGYRAEYESRILALELEQSDDSMDYRRRLRIAAGNCQQILRLMKLVTPRYGGVAFAFLSGKGLRVLMPYLMMVAFLGSMMLAPTYLLFLVLTLLQLMIYLLAGWQILLKPSHSPRVVQTLAYLVSGHFAGLIGSIRYLIGLESGRWKRVT